MTNEKKCNQPKPTKQNKRALWLWKFKIENLIHPKHSFPNQCNFDRECMNKNFIVFLFTSVNNVLVGKFLLANLSKFAATISFSFGACNFCNQYDFGYNKSVFLICRSKPNSGPFCVSEPGVMGRPTWRHPRAPRHFHIVCGSKEQNTVD